METKEKQRAGVFTRTENGALQLRSSGSACLDLFAEVGSARNMVREAPQALEGLFLEAYAEDAATAAAVLFWSRSVRSGAGERDVFFHLLGVLWELCPEAVRDNLPLLAELGCCRDYVRVAERIPELWEDVVSLFAEGVRSGNYYACKFMFYGIIFDLIPGISICNAGSYCHEKDVAQLVFLSISYTWIFDSL